MLAPLFHAHEFELFIAETLVRTAGPLFGIATVGTRNGGVPRDPCRTQCCCGGVECCGGLRILDFRGADFSGGCLNRAGQLNSLLQCAPGGLHGLGRQLMDGFCALHVLGQFRNGIPRKPRLVLRGIQPRQPAL